MYDESIAVALGTIQFVKLPLGHVGFALADVEAAGLDLTEVRAWVDRSGGSEIRRNLPNRSLRAGKVAARSRIVRYFQVPQDQLGL